MAYKLFKNGISAEISKIFQFSLSLPAKFYTQMSLFFSYLKYFEDIKCYLLHILILLGS